MKTVFGDCFSSLFYLKIIHVSKIIWNYFDIIVLQEFKINYKFWKFYFSWQIQNIISINSKTSVKSIIQFG